jgi:hypothetical protein
MALLRPAAGEGRQPDAVGHLQWADAQGGEQVGHQGTRGWDGEESGRTREPELAKRATRRLPVASRDAQRWRKPAGGRSDEQPRANNSAVGSLRHRSSTARHDNDVSSR